MLLPARVKFRKVHRGRRTGVATQGNDLAFGEFGLQASEAAWMSNRQIEAARRVMTRFVRRGGQVFIRVFPDKSVTKKPAETRMGRPKGGGRSGEAGKGWWEEMKMKDLQGLSMPDLQKKLKDSRQELFNLRFQMATGQLHNHRQIRHVRHDLAQILTEIHLKEFNGEPAAAPVEAAPKQRRARAAAVSEEAP